MRARAQRRGSLSGADAGQLESAVGFHRGADIGGPSGVDIKAAIGQLALEDGAGGLLDAHRGGRIPGVVFGLVQEKLQQDVVGFEGGVGGQLAAPETLGRLLGKQGFGRALKRGGDLVRGERHGRFSMVTTYTGNMDWQLDAAEARVLGSLLEKEIATPDYYPLSLNALVNACNQKSNREPVVSYDEDTVETALEGLRAKGLAVRMTGGDSRVPKHGQRFTEKFNLGRREAAVLCVLMLRGPQTVGELRGRSERLYQFEDLEGVESTLNRLVEMEFVKKLPRQTGYKEQRWAQLLAGDVEVAEEAAPTAERGPSDRERIAALERELADLKRAFEEFRRKLRVSNQGDPHWLPPPAALTSENTGLLPKFSPKTRFLPGILRVGRYEVVSDSFPRLRWPARWRRAPAPGWTARTPRAWWSRCLHREADLKPSQAS